MGYSRRAFLEISMWLSFLLPTLAVRPATSRCVMDCRRPSPPGLPSFDCRAGLCGWSRNEVTKSGIDNLAKAKSVFGANLAITGSLQRCTKYPFHIELGGCRNLASVEIGSNGLPPDQAPSIAGPGCRKIGENAGIGITCQILSGCKLQRAPRSPGLMKIIWRLVGICWIGRKRETSTRRFMHFRKP